MKLKHLLVTVLILIVISAGIIAYVKFVHNAPESGSVTDEEESITADDPEIINLKQQIDALDTKLDNTARMWVDNWSSSLTTLTAMKGIIEEIDELAKSNKNVSKLDEYKNLKTKTVDKFITTYEYAFTNKLTTHIYWCDWDGAQQLATADVSKYVPSTLLKDKRLLKLLEGFENRIASAKIQQADISEDVTKFIVSTFKMTEADILAKLNEQEIIAKIKSWIAEFFEFSIGLSPDESDFMYSRLVSAFTKFENAFFKKCDISKNSSYFDFARKYFPLSNELIAYVEESLKTTNNALPQASRDVMNMIRNLRQDFIAFGPINHFFTNRLVSQHYTNYYNDVDYLAYLYQFTADSNSEVLQKYLLSWFNSISFALITSTKYAKDAAYEEILNALIIRSAFSSIFEKALAAQDFEELDIDFNRIRQAIDADVKNLAASKPLNNKDLSLYEVARMYINAHILKADDAYKEVGELLDTKLSDEVTRINAIESQAQQNIEFVEMFTTIDMLISSLEFFSSPALDEVGKITKKHYSNELQHKVIKALQHDEETITELAKKLDGNCSMYFAGFIADLYSKILLGLKGDKEVTQELVNANRGLFFAHYKAYLAFANKVQKDSINTVYDALVFIRIYNNISKMSLIDDMLSPQDHDRKTLLSSLESKYRNNQALIGNLRTGNMLFDLGTAISDIPTNWDAWHELVKVKSQVLKLKMSNTKNQNVRIGIGFIEDLMTRQFYKILMDSFEDQQNDTWVSRAKWFLSNFTLDSIMKNNIDEKMKILIK